MGNYIGNSAPIGIYEKQVFDLSTTGVKKFYLTHKVGYSTSLLVVWEFEGASKILEPDVDYWLVDGGDAIQLSNGFSPYVADDYQERLYAIYLGREIAVPAQRSPLLVQKADVTVEAGGTIFVTDQVFLEASGLLVLKNGQQLRHGQDFDVSTNGHDITISSSCSGASFDFYVLSGINRLDVSDLTDNSITQNKYKNNSITTSKLNLRYAAYTLSVTNTLGGLIVTEVQVDESAYLLQGDNTDSTGIGAPVKVRVKFHARLSGSADNKVRISLPIGIYNVSSLIGGSVVISNDKTLESGILKWAGTDVVDIYRPSGTNYELSFDGLGNTLAGKYTFEAVFDYVTKQNYT